jgi:hypothetical protein
VMDPLLCDDKHCWIRTGGTKDDPTYGATLFPIIQNWDAKCLDCTQNSKLATCNNLDIGDKFLCSLV